MLEALIDKNTGYVIVLAPAGKVWSDFEREYFKVVQWDDADVEVDDVLAYPYDPVDDGDAAIVSVGRPTGLASTPDVGAPATLPQPSKWVDVNAVDLSGSGTLAWSSVEPAVRTA